NYYANHPQHPSFPTRRSSDLKLFAIAKQTGAQAIHPGYGFLSENAEFARRCAREKIVFLGPTPEQMEAFGLKHTARKLAEASDLDRKSTRLNSSHVKISYAVF